MWCVGCVCVWLCGVECVSARRFNQQNVSHDVDDIQTSKFDDAGNRHRGDRSGRLMKLTRRIRGLTKKNTQTYKNRFNEHKP